MKRVAWLGPLVVAGGFALCSACVLADPPPTLPPVVQQAPRILNPSVVPLLNQVITQWPTSFSVPVQILTPGQGVYWQMSVDSAAFMAGVGGVALTPGGPLAPDGGDEVILPVSYAPPLVAPGCHTITLVVMFELANGDPDTNPSDESVIGWQYNPSGSSASCGTFDAGALNDGSLPDAGAAD